MSSSILPGDWKKKLRVCNYAATKRGIQKFFSHLEEEGRRKDGFNALDPKLYKAWNAFRNDPQYKTAVALIEVWPRSFEFFFPPVNFFGGVTAENFQIGPYSLGMNLQGIRGILPQTSLVPSLHGEQIFYAPEYYDVDGTWGVWLVEWWRTIAKIISLNRIPGKQNSIKFRHVMLRVFERYEEKLGAPTFEKGHPESYMRPGEGFFWQFEDGIVLLEAAYYVSSISSFLEIRIHCSRHEYERALSAKSSQMANTWLNYSLLDFPRTMCQPE